MALSALKGIWDMKQRMLVLLLALRDKRTPVAGKVLALLALAYLVSPIDVLFDGIPFLGIIDDLILVPFGLWLANKRIPPSVQSAAKAEAEKYDGFLRKVVYVLLAFLFIWLLAALLLVALLVRVLVG